MPDALTLIETRKSHPSVLLAEPGPSEAEVERLVTLAARVSDHGKLAPWRFVVYRGPGKARIGEALLAAALARDPAADEAKRTKERRRFDAPVVIAVVSKAGPHPKIPEFEQVLSAGAACQNLLLGAMAMGYGAQWLTGPAADIPEVARFLGLRDGERFAGFIHIGTPKGEAADRPRPALADVLTVWTPA